jgi:hypothetical protein
MKRLRSRIIRLFETGTIADDSGGGSGSGSGSGKRQKLECLVKKEMVSIYCIYVYTPLYYYAIIFTSTKKIAEQLNK